MKRLNIMLISKNKIFIFCNYKKRIDQNIFKFKIPVVSSCFSL